MKLTLAATVLLVGVVALGVEARPKMATDLEALGFFRKFAALSLIASKAKTSNGADPVWTDCSKLSC